MSAFRKSIPSEFTDEDRWRFGPVSLSRTTFIVSLIGLGITCVLYKVLGLIGLPKVGILIGIVGTIIAAVLTSQTIPESDYLKGGGVTLIVMLKRLYIRKKNKVVYIRGYGRDIRR